MNNNVFKNLSYGVYIISCEDNGRYTGCTVNSIMQITSNPAKIALSLNHDNYTHSCICKSKKCAVSILSEKSLPLSIGMFGFRSGKEAPNRRTHSDEWSFLHPKLCRQEFWIRVTYVFSFDM